MIDFVKVQLTNINVNMLLENKYLEFKRIVSQKTGELEYKTIAEYQQLKFIVYDSGYVLLQGSLHKFYNSINNICGENQSTEIQKQKGFNGNNFDLNQIQWTLNYLSKKFRFLLNDAKLRNIEFGLNISHSYNTRNILSNLIRHNGHEFLHSEKWFYKCEHIQFIIKCYDKQKQYKLAKPTIRIELKYIKQEQIKNYGISSLEHLMNPNLLSKLKQLLLKRWNEILMFDYTIEESKLSKTKFNLVQQFKNKNYWNNNYKLKPCQMDIKKKQYKYIVLKHSQQIQLEIGKIIHSEWEKLTEMH